MLNVQDLRLSYRSDAGPVNAVRGISFCVEQGNFFTLLGPSGCGKTSTLRCIAGLETPTAGQIEIGRQVVYSSASRTMVPTHKRDIGMVFQSYAIWPHMTVFDNVAFPLRHGGQKLTARAIQERVMHALSMVQLDSFAQRPAPQLSGGQQQRVALARAIAREPAVLLLDEPLSNLDARLREDMRHEIKALVKRLGTTTLYVTHDQLEALSMSDTVALVREGQIVQSGAPRDVYLKPADAFAANFLGRTNLLPGTVAATAEHGYGTVATPWGELRCAVPDGLAPGSEVTLGFRPEGVELYASPPVASASHGVLEGRIVATTFAGDALEVVVDLGGPTVRVRGTPYAAYADGQQVWLDVPADRCYVLDTLTSPAGQGAPEASLTLSAAR